MDLINIINTIQSQQRQAVMATLPVYGNGAPQAYMTPQQEGMLSVNAGGAAFLEFSLDPIAAAIAAPQALVALAQQGTVQNSTDMILLKVALAKKLLREKAENAKPKIEETKKANALMKLLTLIKLAKSGQVGIPTETSEIERGKQDALKLVAAVKADKEKTAKKASNKEPSA